MRRYEFVTGQLADCKIQFKRLKMGQEGNPGLKKVKNNLHPVPEKPIFAPESIICIAAPRPVMPALPGMDPVLFSTFFPGDFSNCPLTFL
jgi:hypothetical protein